nr:hypothetical protein [Kiritimatiellia bacterium]
MKTKFYASVCAVFAAFSLFAAETVATFTSLTSGATSGTYSYGSHSSGSGGYLTGGSSWAASDGVTMILTYSGLPSSGDYAIATLARTDSTTYSYFGISSRSGRLTGFYKGSMWDSVKSGSTLASSGTLVFTFRANGTSNNGVTVYDNSANVIYSAPKLVESNNFSIGENFDFAGSDSGTFSADGFTVDSVEILNGALTAEEVAAKMGGSSDSSSSIDWTVGDTTYTFDLLFRGTTDATFETLGNWYSNKFTVVESEGVAVTNWIAYAESA